MKKGTKRKIKIEYLKDQAMDLLLLHVREHELEGVELTEEDAANVVALIEKGHTPEEAANIVLGGIRDVLDETSS